MKTSTKKRGRPLGSKKAKVTDWDKQWQEFELPDSEATVEQVRNAGKWLGLEEPKINYWKYACVAILLGIVTAMIFSTPIIISMFDACTL